MTDPAAVLTDRSLLITGGTGAFGLAFARRALEAGARRVALFARGEARQAEAKRLLTDDRMRWLVGDVRSELRVMDALRGVELVVHAAALKRVEVCEADPAEAVMTNVVGTMHVARACIERGVARAVFLSTDKAAAPNTLYGSTKQTAERLWLGANVYSAGTATRFAATRYGNVLGSTGSVVPLWRQQAAAGRPLTITDPACSRFWMTMDQAVDLVLLALGAMEGGEVFVPKVGAARLPTLASAVAPGAPWEAHGGLRPGEKLHEMLISEDEARQAVDHGDHWRLLPWERLLSSHRAPVSWSYTSRNAPPLSVDALRRMIGEGV